MSLELVVTTLGFAAVPDGLAIAEVGISASHFAPDAATVALPDEIKRINTVSGEATSPNQIHLLVRDLTTDAYSLRALALYLADGTLFAAYSQPDPIMAKAPASIMLLALDLAFADIDTAAITFGDADFVNPPATETTAGVLKLASSAQVTAGTSADTAVTPLTLAERFDALIAALAANPHSTQLGEGRTFHRKIPESEFYKFPDGQHLALPDYQDLADALAGDPFLAVDAADKAANPGKWLITDTYIVMPDMRGQFERIWADDLAAGGVTRPGLGVRKANQNRSHRHDLPSNQSDDTGNAYVADSAGGETNRIAYTGYEGGDEAVPDHTAIWYLIRVL